jgi:hypothetical protein
MNRKQIVAIAKQIVAIAIVGSLLIFVISPMLSDETPPSAATGGGRPITPPITPPVVTSEITFTYDGGTHPVFDLIAEQGYDRDNLRRIIIDYLNGHPDKATLCGSANCNINNLH